MTYFWKVNEINEAEAVPSWDGDLWTFSTLEFVTVDDFESYNDDDNLIYEVWLDGWVERDRLDRGLLRGAVRRADDRPRRYSIDAAGIQQHGVAVLLRGGIRSRRR